MLLNIVLMGELFLENMNYYDEIKNKINICKS